MFSLCFIVTSQRLQLLLSYAVGGLLGDVFLHLLPEAWMYLGKGSMPKLYTILMIVL